MTPRSEGFASHRVLVAIDASSQSLAALDAAAQLAGRLHLELVGLFVEDTNLIRVGRMPDALHVSLPSGSAGEPFDATALEAQLRMLAADAEAALLAAARRARIAGSFRVVRGSVVSEVLAAAGEADLLILGSASRPVVRRSPLGRTAQAAAERATASVLLLPPKTGLSGPVAALYDGAAGCEAALLAGARLAEAVQDALAVIAVGPSREAARAQAASAQEWIGLNRPALRCRVLGIATVGLRGALRAEHSGVLVVSAKSPVVRGDELRQLLEEVEIPVLLVREPIPGLAQSPR